MSEGKRGTRGRRPKKTEPEKSPYQVLEVPETATQDEIRKAYLKKLRTCSPERDPEGFKIVRKAYGLLENAAAKRAVDMTLFLTKSDFDPGAWKEPDFAGLFRECLLDFVIAQTDFYIDGFDSHPDDIFEISRKNAVDEKVRNLS